MSIISQIGTFWMLFVNILFVLLWLAAFLLIALGIGVYVAIVLVLFLNEKYLQGISLIVISAIFITLFGPF